MLYSSFKWSVMTGLGNLTVPLDHRVGIFLKVGGYSHETKVAIM